MNRATAIVRDVVLEYSVGADIPVTITRLQQHQRDGNIVPVGNEAARAAQHKDGYEARANGSHDRGTHGHSTIEKPAPDRPGQADDPGSEKPRCEASREDDSARIIFSRIIDAVGRAEACSMPAKRKIMPDSLESVPRSERSGKIFIRSGRSKDPGIVGECKTVLKTSKTASGTKSPDNRAMC